MARQILNPNSLAPNDKLGDTPFDYTTKLNAMTEELYAGSTANTNGFMDYNDTSTTITPITLLGNTWITVPNNGLGSFTSKTYAPSGVTELMDVSNGNIVPLDLPLGSTMLIRNDYTVTPNTNNALLEFRYTLGTGGGAYTLEKIVGRLDSGSGIGYRRSLVPDLIYLGDLNTRDNPIGLEVRLSAGGTLVNAGSAIQVIKQ